MILEVNSLDLELKNYINEVIETSNLAHSDYYGYRVCAMIIDEAGNKYKGVNFEPSNGKSVCAESNALGSYFLSKMEKVKCIVLYGSRINGEKRDDVYCFPCGSCRQMLSDFIDESTEIYALNESITKVNKVQMKELLPFGFSKNNL